MTTDRKTLATVLAVLLSAAPLAAGAAETRPDPAQKPEPAPKSAPGNPAAAPPEKVAPAEPLSDQLARSGGTIKPPTDVDPGMAQTPPDTGPRSMPVIPPPGAPGGNPTVKPK